MINAFKTKLRRKDNLYPNALLLTALPESPSENVFTCPSIVCVTSGPNSGRCMFPSESFTPNAWYPSTEKDCGH